MFSEAFNRYSACLSFGIERSHTLLFYQATYTEGLILLGLTHVSRCEFDAKINLLTGFQAVAADSLTSTSLMWMKRPYDFSVTWLVLWRPMALPASIPCCSQTFERR